MARYQQHEGECPPDGKHDNGRCAGKCFSCGEHLLLTGRYTSYCPDCDCCVECGCYNVDGFVHSESCKEAPLEDNHG